MNPIKRIKSVFTRTPEKQEKSEKNSIANDFLRRGNQRTRLDVKFDQKLNPELNVNGWLYAALNTRADSFAQFCEDNIITANDKNIDEYHTYLNLIENSESFSEFEFWRDIISDYDIYGQVFIFLLRRVVMKK